MNTEATATNYKSGKDLDLDAVIDLDVFDEGSTTRAGVTRETDDACQHAGAEEKGKSGVFVRGH